VQPWKTSLNFQTGVNNTWGDLLTEFHWPQIIVLDNT